MATPSEIMARIDGLLDAISADVDFLPELARSWDAMPERDRIIWDIEWTELTDRLEILETGYRAGEMTSEQDARYCELRRQLKQAIPLLEHLDLAPPPIRLDDAEAA